MHSTEVSPPNDDVPELVTPAADIPSEDTSYDVNMAPGWERLRPFEQLLLDDNEGRNTPLITAIYRLHSARAKPWVVRHIAVPLSTHPRFCSIIPDVKNPKRFVLDPEFNPSNHVTVRNEALASHVLDELLSTPLPASQPLWNMYVFSDGNVVLRLHHAIGDGIGLIEFAMRAISSTDKNNGNKISSGNGADSNRSELCERKPMHEALVFNQARPTMLDKLMRPFTSVYSSIITILIPETGSVLTSKGGPLSPLKHAGWSKEYSVTYLRNICRQIGITLNDLLLAVVSGSMRRYMESVESPRPKRMRLGVPFNGHPTPDLVDKNVVYNALIVLVLPLTINESSILKRLARTSRHTQNAKNGYGIPLSLMAFKVLGALPVSIRVRIWRHVTKSISLVFSNVPGPNKSIFVDDTEIVGMKVLSPAQGSCPLTISAFSYNDKINMGVVSDRNRLQHPQKLMDIFDEEMEAVLTWIKQLDE